MAGSAAFVWAIINRCNMVAVQGTPLVLPAVRRLQHATGSFGHHPEQIPHQRRVAIRIDLVQSMPVISMGIF